LLDRYPRIQPAQLELEILETTALADMDAVNAIIHRCKQSGIRIALDDFGTGYSSLTYFRRLTTDTLKIDISFIRDMLDDPEDLSIVEGVVGLTSAFGRTAIAEGVETSQHGVMLLNLGCDLGQGFGIARPMPGAAIPDWAAGFSPDPAWASSLSLKWSREDFPLFSAEVEHTHWVADIKEALGSGNVTALDDLAQTTCRFEHWLAQQGRGRYGAHPSFAVLEPLHAELHAQGAAIVATYRQDNLVEAQTQLVQLQTTLQRFVEALAEFRAEVAMSQYFAEHDRILH
jgi:hypothetical protein